MYVHVNCTYTTAQKEYIHRQIKYNQKPRQQDFGPRFGNVKADPFLTLVGAFMTDKL